MDNPRISERECAKGHGCKKGKNLQTNIVKNSQDPEILPYWQASKLAYHS